jgi:hypothetical protein
MADPTDFKKGLALMKLHAVRNTGAARAAIDKNDIL